MYQTPSYPTGAVRKKKGKVPIEHDHGSDRAPSPNSGLPAPTPDFVWNVLQVKHGLPIGQEDIGTPEWVGQLEDVEQCVGPTDDEILLEEFGLEVAAPPINRLPVACTAMEARTDLEQLSIDWEKYLPKRPYPGPTHGCICVHSPPLSTVFEVDDRLVAIPGDNGEGRVVHGRLCPHGTGITLFPWHHEVQPLDALLRIASGDRHPLFITAHHHATWGLLFCMLASALGTVAYMVGEDECSACASHRAAEKDCRLAGGTLGMLPRTTLGTDSPLLAILVSQHVEGLRHHIGHSSRDVWMRCAH
ncbi:uncharacterized protein VTP21DRAFT_4982 [Calcarisporiella thermophila]|uniref:uncharacterized protein n=1 Tax=Calcarisporiella thermophila TaxID=911321 RepID=UPI0037441994